MHLTVDGVAPLVEEALQKAFSSVDDGPDVCVMGAGGGPTGPLVDLDPGDWAALVARVRTAAFTAQRIVKDAVASGRPARVVFITSPASVTAVPGLGVDAIAGAFLQTLGRVAAVELGPRGVNVNIVVGGWTRDEVDIDADIDLEAHIPSGRYATPDEIAGVCAFLASDAASYITGAVITVDGGFSISKGDGPNPFLPR